MIALETTLHHLEGLSLDARWQHFEAMEHRGQATLRTPDMANNWDAAVYVINAHGIDAVGASKREALHLWTTCAARVIAEEEETPDRLAWAVALIEGTQAVAIHDAVAACRLILDQGAGVSEGLQARGRAILNAIAASEGTTFNALRTGQQVAP